MLEIGSRPLLMGIVNATPDSFSDGGDHPTLEARFAHGAALLEAGADLLDVGGESARGYRPAVDAGEEIERVVPLIVRLRRARRGRLGRHVQAGGGRGGDRRRAPCSSTTSPACATRRWPTSARATGAGLVVMHTRVEPKGTLLDPEHYDDVVADVPGSCASGWSSRSARGVAAGADRARPGARLRQDAGADGRGAARDSSRCTALGRPLLLAVSNKDFVGAITGRAPARAAARARSPRSRMASTRARRSLRVHDVAAAADFLRVRAVLARRGRARTRRGPRRRIATLRDAWVAGRCAQRGRMPTDHRFKEMTNVIRA